MKTLRLIGIIIGIITGVLAITTTLGSDLNSTLRAFANLGAAGQCWWRRWNTLELNPRNAAANVLTIKVDKFMLAIDEPLDFSYQVKRSGFVSIWNISSSGGEASRLSAPTLSEPGQLITAGKLGFELIATPPAGLDSLLALWTAQPQQQPQADTFADRAALQQALAGVNTTIGLDEASYCIFQP